jgi:Arc/MetJ-type ribon-helix-helix transcriptional regulator
MALTLTLDRHDEQIVEAQLRTGRYKSPEQVVARALETLSAKGPVARLSTKTVAEAVAHIRASRKGVTLGGLKIKDLIHEGHRY